MAHTFSQGIAFGGIILAKFAFGYFFDLFTKRIIRRDLFFIDLTNSPEHINGKKISAIFTG